MAFVLKDRVMESSTTTGTGAFTLAGAYTTGYRTFASVCSVADTTRYCIEAIDSNGNASGDWEVGLGTYSATNTLTRTTVVASSNSNAAVNFAAGSKRVTLDADAAYLVSLTGTAYTDEQAQDAVAAMLAAGTHTNVTVTYNDAGNSMSLAATGGSSLATANEWAPNFTAAGDVYIPAVVAMTIDQGNAAIGTGTLAYTKSTTAAPSTFSSTTLPATLQAGAWLKVSASAVTGFVATHLKRTA